VFLKPVTALSGPLAPIVVPRCAQPVEKHQPDLEVELVAVLGRPARDVSEAEALDYVLGYTAGNDVSFRHHQFNVSQWDYSKGFGELGGA
jgi:2-keto-4-pentenoate hydratase/2-oxohepta-3-ene-1,7-dioic acid hydratase in catechol pathway